MPEISQFLCFAVLCLGIPGPTDAGAIAHGSDLDVSDIVLRFQLVVPGCPELCGNRISQLPATGVGGDGEVEGGPVAEFAFNL